MADDGSAAKKQFSEQLINVRLKEELLQALREGEILRARLLLRALSCLFSCNSFSPQSYLAVLSALLEAAGGGEYGNSEGEQAQTAGISPSRSSEATFLLACSIPWSIAAISALGQAQETAEEVEGLLARLEAFFRQLLGQADGSLGWAELLSPYRVGGKLEVFHTPPPPPYSGVEHFVAVDPCNTWPGQARDALFEASTFALQLISAARSNGAIPSPLSSSRCQLFPWTDADAREALSTQPFRMTTFGSHQDVQTEILAAFRTDSTANCLAGFTAGAGLSGSPSCRQGQWFILWCFCSMYSAWELLYTAWPRLASCLALPVLAALLALALGASNLTRQLPPLQRRLHTPTRAALLQAITTRQPHYLSTPRHRPTRA